MNLNAKFLNDRIALNLLARDVENAKEIYKAIDGYVLVGVLSKDFPSVEEAVIKMREYQESIDNALSIGLGAGDPNQWKMVSEICRIIKPQHVNQVFTGVGHTRSSLNNDETLINSLVSPCGKVGYVKISTGPLSSKGVESIVPVESAINMIKDMGGSSIKYFPMEGLKYHKEYEAVAKACAEMNFILEPTGGIDLSNFQEICEIALKAGVKKVIPHVYTSIIDKNTKLTKIEDVLYLYEIMKKLSVKYSG